LTSTSAEALAQQIALLRDIARHYLAPGGDDERASRMSGVDSAMNSFMVDKGSLSFADASTVAYCKISVTYY
jgi:hypothetical protein